MNKQILVAPKSHHSIHAVQNKKAVNLDSVEAMTPEKDKMVYGTFLNIEYPGQTAKVCGKYYKGMQYFEKVMEDNQKYSIPWSVARWINERIYFEQHTHLLDENGQAMKGGKKQARYKFIIESMAA